MAIDDRTTLLLGQNNIDKLSTFKVCVLGVGGVGSIIPLTLVRSGIKKIKIIDKDVVDRSNLNRQMAYESIDVGKNKVDVLKEKLLKIRDDISITTSVQNIGKEFDFSILDDCDYVFDCIDDIQAKIEIIRYCQNKKIKLIVSLGMGNKLDPSKLIVTTLNKTTIDPLAKKMRYELKKNSVDISNINVVFSTETPIIKSRVISSIAFVPNAAGLLMVSYAIRDLLKLL